MTTPRKLHSATLLPDGMVLIAGGIGAGTVELKSAELFDPATGAFTPLPDMSAIRYSHSAILLNTGKVLIVGGGDFYNSQYTELYDPATKQFARTGDLQNARKAPSANLLPDGRVLVAGGFEESYPGNALSTAELYDPSSGNWTLTGPMNSARSHHSATLLQDGRVLLSGGVDATYNGVSSSEAFDPGTGAFTPVGNMSIARDSQTSVLLPDGTVLMLGGWATTTTTSGSSSSTSANSLDSFEIFDPALNTFHAGSEIPPIYGGGALTIVEPTGVVLCFWNSKLFVYHPA